MIEHTKPQSQVSTSGMTNLELGCMHRFIKQRIDSRGKILNSRNKSTQHVDHWSRKNGGRELLDTRGNKTLNPCLSRWREICRILDLRSNAKTHVAQLKITSIFKKKLKTQKKHTELPQPPRELLDLRGNEALNPCLHNCLETYRNLDLGSGAKELQTTIISEFTTKAANCKHPPKRCLVA